MTGRRTTIPEVTIHGYDRRRLTKWAFSAIPAIYWRWYSNTDLGAVIRRGQQHLPLTPGMDANSPGQSFSTEPHRTGLASFCRIFITKHFN